MAKNEQCLADLLFWVQIAGALLFAVPLFIRTQTTVNGYSQAQALLVEVYLCMIFFLLQGAYRERPSRTTLQGIISCILWMVLLGAVLVSVAAGNKYEWSWHDSLMLITAGTSTLVLVLVMKTAKLSLRDPLVSGWLAIAYKSIPQLLLMFKFVSEGSSGFPGLTMFTGHANIVVRLLFLVIMNKEAAWDRNRKWLWNSEIANWISWTLATIAWAVS